MDYLFIRTSNYTSGDHPENVRAPLDIGYAVSISRKKGFDVGIVDMKAENLTVEEVKAKISDLCPDKVFIRTETPCVKISKRIAEFCGESEVYFFGQHPTVNPETFLGEDDRYCIRGELDSVIPEIAEGTNPENIEGVDYKNSRSSVRKVEDLDDLPIPSHEEFLDENYGEIIPMSVGKSATFGYVLSSRGCPFNCIYCSPTLRVSYGRKMRFRDPVKVVDELEYLVDKGVEAIVFKDDIFTISEQHALMICEEIIDRGIEVPWFAQTRADCISDNLAEKMSEAGCRLVGIGVESGSERVLNLLKKEESKEEIRKGVETVKKHGMDVITYFMIGSPTETKKELEKSLEFCLKLEPDMIQVAFFTPYPGSEAYENCIEGQLEPGEFHHYNGITFNSSKVTDSYLSFFQKKFYIRYGFSKGFLKGFFKRKLRNPLDFSTEKEYFLKGVKFLFG